MSDTVAPRYTIAASLRWFALVYTTTTLALVAAIVVAAQYGISAPSTGLSIGAYIGVVYAAGSRFAEKSSGTWTPRDQNWLAIGYTAVSFGVSAILVAVFAQFDSATRADLDLVVSDGIVAIAIAIPLVFAFFWGGARLSLAMVARRKRKT